MVVNGLRDQDKLDGASNFVIWKARILAVLDKNRIKDYALKTGVVSVDVDPLKKYEEAQEKVKFMILDGVKDHAYWFVLGFSHITWPLSQVTKGGAKEKFFWSATQQKAFFELKNRLCFAPVLTLLDMQQPFEIETDAFDYAIGVVLTQRRHPIA
eukprot:PITA_26687